ncbi:MAG: glycosyl transferase group 1 [Fibrobacteres bacterium]|nr:glycosyl transferase group 1 [Fibrobacterota bacterium]
MSEHASSKPSAPPVQVAHAIHSGGFYGAEKVICDLAREQLASSGCAPRLFAILDPGQAGNEVADRASALGLPVSLIHAPVGISFKGLRNYARALIEAGVVLVHSHGYKATAFHLCSRWLGMHRVPLVVTAHGYSKSSGSLKSAIYRWLDIVFLGAADSVVAVSHEMESYLRARNPVVRLRTIPNGISPQIRVEESHPLLSALGILPGDPRPPVIGTAGRLVPMKNHAMLIRAYAELRKIVPCRLVIIGEGPLRSSLEQLWRELIPDEPVGLYPFQSQVLDWVADMDVFALPSNDGEGLPMALLEAGLLERAVVCSDSGGMPELVRDWITGRLIHMGDQDALVKALEDLVLSPENRAAYGKALRKEVLADHDIRATHGRYLETYAQVLAVD